MRVKKITVERALTIFTDWVNKGFPVAPEMFMTSMCKEDYREFKELAKTTLLIKRSLDSFFVDVSFRCLQSAYKIIGNKVLKN
jgi:hypothetical protein